MNFNVFDRAAQVTGRKMDNFSDDIDSQLAEAQSRHTQRLEALRQQFDSETELINQGLGYTLDNGTQTPYRPRSLPTSARTVRPGRNASTKPRWAPNLWHVAGLVLLAFLASQLASMGNHAEHRSTPSQGGAQHLHNSI